MPEIGRNAPCPCGSGLKYKRCCALKEERTSVGSRIALSLVALMLIGGAIFLLASLNEFGDRSGAQTRVWSEAHGHWH
jgi:SEC-C motif